MMAVKVIFMVIMVIEFVCNIYYINKNSKTGNATFWAMLYNFVKFFLFVWLVANRNFF